MNSCELTGKVLSEPVLERDGKYDRYGRVKIGVNRPFRNNEGMYVMDCFEVMLRHGLADICKDTMIPGSYVAIRGRLQMSESDSKNYEIIAETLELIGSRGN